VPLCWLLVVTLFTKGLHEQQQQQQQHKNGKSFKNINY